MAPQPTTSLIGWPANVAAGFHISGGNHGFAISAKAATTFRLIHFYGFDATNFLPEDNSRRSAVGRPLDKLAPIAI